MEYILVSSSLPPNNDIYSNFQYRWMAEMLCSKVEEAQHPASSKRCYIRKRIWTLQRSITSSSRIYLRALTELVNYLFQADELE